MVFWEAFNKFSHRVLYWTNCTVAVSKIKTYIILNFWLIKNLPMPCTRIYIRILYWTNSSVAVAYKHIYNLELLFDQISHTPCTRNTLGSLISSNNSITYMISEIMLSRVHVAMSGIWNHSVVIGTDCTGSCKSNYHMITSTMAPTNLLLILIINTNPSINQCSIWKVDRGQ